MLEEIKNIYTWLELSGHKFENKENVSLALSLVDEEVAELKEAIQNDDKIEIIDALVDIFWMCKNVSFFYGITPEEIVNHSKLVLKSNYSKFPISEQIAIDSVEAYQSGEHPSKLGTRIDTYYEKTGNEEFPFVIKRHDHKVLKGLGFKSVNEMIYEKKS